MEGYQATLIGAAIAAVAGFVGFVWSSSMTPTSIAAKIWDRIYMIDNALLANPCAQLVLMRESKRATPYFYDFGDHNNDELFVKVKALVYFTSVRLIS